MASSITRETAYATSVTTSNEREVRAKADADWSDEFTVYVSSVYVTS